MFLATRYRLLLAVALIFPVRTQACSPFRMPTPMELVNESEMIVRVKAISYERAPDNPHIWTTGVPDSIVRFQILETIKGNKLNKVVLHGYLKEADDFNDQKPPYTFVRPGGRSGSCFANSYRGGAEYLLFLQSDEHSHEWTVNWAPLAPVNEELHDEQDPWLIWVRAQAKQTQVMAPARLLP